MTAPHRLSPHELAALKASLPDQISLQSVTYVYDLRCRYEHGMFSDAGHITGATAYHEAGHGVVGYALGLGCLWIKVSPEYSGGGGSAQFPKRSAFRPQARRRLVAGVMTAADLRRLVTAGIVSAAGMAAERKLAFLLGLGVSVTAALGGGCVSDHDHRLIEMTDKALSVHERRRPFAFERLVWARAQSAMDDPRIWGAVEEIAERFEFGLAGWSRHDDDDTGTTTMHGPEARAIMRRNGVLPGMKWGPSERALSAQSSLGRTTARPTNLGREFLSADHDDRSDNP